MKNSVTTSKSAQQRGFTIVEIMIAMLIGLILMLGVVSLMVSNKRNFSEQEEMSRLQENARLALQFLTSDLRMPFYMGCQARVDDTYDCVTSSNDGSLTPAPACLSYADADSLYQKISISSGGAGLESDVASLRTSMPLVDLRDMDDPISGTDGGGSASDSITVVYAKRTPITLEKSMTDAAADIEVDLNGQALDTGDTLAIGDCMTMSIFEVTGRTDLPSGNTLIEHSAPTNRDNGNLARAYAAGGEVSIYNLTKESSYTYSVNNGNLERSGKVLVGGVENMQLLYGDGSQFVTADAITNWSAVNSIRVALLMRTEQEKGTDIDTSTYDLLGTTIDPPDLRVRRKVFQTTLRIRNAGLGL